MHMHDRTHALERGVKYGHNDESVEERMRQRWRLMTGVVGALCVFGACRSAPEVTPEQSACERDRALLERTRLRPFISTWEVHQEDLTLTIPTGQGAFLYDVDWDGDGIFDDLNLTGLATHTYEEPGVYRIAIRGQFPHMQFVSEDYLAELPERCPKKSQLVAVSHWGDVQWTSMRGMFACTGLRSLPNSPPDLSEVHDMSFMFMESDFDQPLQGWDVSPVTTMRAMFRCSPFSQPLEGWDVSHVTDMSHMFRFSGFNQPLNALDVSRVTNMSHMFEHTAFDQPLGDWKTSNVTDMSAMFMHAKSFNQPLESWDTSSVTDMSEMFVTAYEFNQPLEKWDVSAVKNMYNMFFYARSFIQPLDAWRVSDDAITYPMFEGSAMTSVPGWYKKK